MKCPNCGSEKHGRVVYLLTIAMMISGCASLGQDSPVTPVMGRYRTELTVVVAGQCRGIEGYFRVVSENEYVVCISAHNSQADWRDIWYHEVDHLFNHLTGIPQRKEKKLVVIGGTYYRE